MWTRMTRSGKTPLIAPTGCAPVCALTVTGASGLNRKYVHTRTASVMNVWSDGKKPPVVRLLTAMSAPWRTNSCARDCTAPNTPRLVERRSAEPSTRMSES